jgi:hypothetical protein
MCVPFECQWDRGSELWVCNPNRRKFEGFIHAYPSVPDRSSWKQGTTLPRAFNIYCSAWYLAPTQLRLRIILLLTPVCRRGSWQKVDYLCPKPSISSQILYTYWWDFVMTELCAQFSRGKSLLDYIHLEGNTYEDDDRVIVEVQSGLVPKELKVSARWAPLATNLWFWDRGWEACVRPPIFPRLYTNPLVHWNIALMVMRRVHSRVQVGN